MIQPIDELLEKYNMDIDKLNELTKQQTIMRELLFLDREKTIDQCISIVDGGLRPLEIPTQWKQALVKLLTDYKEQVHNIYHINTESDDTTY